MPSKNIETRNRNLLGAIGAVLLVLGFIGLVCKILDTNTDKDLSQYVPSSITSKQLETALEKQSTQITSIRFEQHGDLENITLANYDARNYCALIYGETSEDPLHILVSDIIVVQDEALSNSYFIPLDNERCILKISEDTFVSQLSKELFVDMSEEQLDFILNFLFRNV